MAGLLDLIAVLRGGLLGTPAVTGVAPQLDGDANPIPGAGSVYDMPGPGSVGQGPAPVGAPAFVPLPRPRPAIADGDASPAAAPTPMPGGASAPDFGTRLSAGLAGFANSPGPVGSLVNLIGGVATGQRMDPVGQRMQLLQSMGISPQLAPFIARSPQLMQAIVARRLMQQEQPPTAGEAARTRDLPASAIATRNGVRMIRRNGAWVKY